MKRTLFLYTVLQAAEWVVFLLCDMCQEYRLNEGLVWLYLLAAPLLTGVLFCIYEKRLRAQIGLRRRVPHCFAAAGIWIVECVVFGVLFFMLIDAEIIPQHTDGWEWLLNGIEYMAFPLLNSLGALIVIAVGLLCVKLHEVIRARRRSV